MDDVRETVLAAMAYAERPGSEGEVGSDVPELEVVLQGNMVLVGSVELEGDVLKVWRRILQYEPGWETTPVFVPLSRVVMAVPVVYAPGAGGDLERTTRSFVR